MTKIKDKEERKDQFVGAYVPPQLARLLTIRALYLNTTKTHLLCKMIEGVKDEISVQEMLTVIAQRFGVEWVCIVNTNCYKKDWGTDVKVLAHFEKYIEKITQEFRSHKLEDKDIRVITQKIRMVFGLG